MDIGLMRLIWSVIEEMPALRGGDALSREQIRLILHRIDNRVRLSPQERLEVQQYLAERQPLIQAMYLEQVM